MPRSQSPPSLCNAHCTNLNAKERHLIYFERSFGCCDFVGYSAEAKRSFTAGGAFTVQVFREGKMSGLSSMFMKTLGITPDGKCAKHPQIILLCDENSALLQECDLCWKEQHGKREQAAVAGEEDTEKLAAVSPTGLCTIPSGSTSLSFTSSGEKDSAWLDSVQMRWSQVEELGVGTMLENTGLLNKENESKKQSEVDPEEIARSRTNQHLKKLEEHIKHQNAAIQKLQETVERQESTIRQDIQQLRQTVSMLTGLELPTQRDNPENYHDSGITSPMENISKKNGQQRPGMYSKMQHPSNMFTSVRTIERKPPRPPMRHGSFSTYTGSRVGGSMRSASVSSLGTSTRTGQTNEQTANHDIEVDINLTGQYCPEMQSLLEKERTKQLEIIFDASGMLSTDNLDESGNNDDANNGGRSPLVVGERSKDKSPSSTSKRASSTSLQLTSEDLGTYVPNQEEKKQSNSPASACKPLRKPMRAPSERDMDCQVSASSPRPGDVGDSPGKATKTKQTEYVPPTPPPPPTEEPRDHSTRQSSRRDPASNLAKLSTGTAPPRREIFAAWRSSKMQISCLTIDTALDQSEAGEQANDGTVHREVKNHVITDKFGDSGHFTGRVREDNDGKGNKICEPDGYGAMSYNNGAFYIGTWKAGHW